MMSSDEILPIGDYLQLDEQGFFINPCSLKLLKTPWSYAVTDIVDAYLENIGALLHSVYIRGSVAKGTAIQNISDIDTFAIVENSAKSIDMSWRHEFCLNLNEKYKFHTGIEFGLANLKDVIGDDVNRDICFLIKVQSLCVWGQDVSHSIQPFKVDRYLANRIEYIEKDISHALDALEEWPAGEKVKDVCNWIMKRIVRTGFLLVYERENTFTRDLYPCFISFSKYFPEKVESMKFALEKAIFPTSNSEELKAFLNDFGGWIVNHVNCKANTIKAF